MSWEGSKLLYSYFTFIAEHNIMLMQNISRTLFKLHFTSRERKSCFCYLFVFASHPSITWLALCFVQYILIWMGEDATWGFTSGNKMSSPVRQHLKSTKPQTKQWLTWFSLSSNKGKFTGQLCYRGSLWRRIKDNADELYHPCLGNGVGKMLQRELTGNVRK